MNPAANPAGEPALIVVNPSAGRAGDLRNALTNGMTARGIPGDVVVTNSVDEMEHRIHVAVADGTTRFLAVGGDGTAHHLLNALPLDVDAAPRFSFGLLPSGTGSDFVRTFGQTADVGRALDRLAEPTPYGVDVGWVEGSFGRRWFLNAANAGIAAESVTTADRLPRRLGASRYTAAFWLTLPRFRGAAITVDVDRHHFEGQALNVVVANGQYFGGGLNVAPRATLVDGSLDVLVFRGPRSNAFTVMPRIAIGSHLTHRAVQRFVGSQISIGVPDDWPIEADGEALGRGHVHIGIRPDAVDYLV